MPADQPTIEALVARYQRLTPAQRRAYNEANTRKDFIEPLFEALGWNVRSKEEVDAEKLVRPGFADYAFLQHGVVRFYVEAKPLDDDIYQDEYARQVITYAYSKGTAWAVLTNFARLVVFDALEQLDGGAPRRVLDLECGDYVSSLNLLTLLTPESLADGSLTAHAERIGVRRRAIPIEKRLYESMRGWREELFNDMATALGWRTDQQLRKGDEAIQRLLDRLIFLRNCEDRGIGEPGLRALCNRLRSRGGNVRVAESLLRLFDHAASTYDSELFQTDALIDVFMRGLGTILDGTLAEVIEGLYSVPKSFAAYDFGLIDADVLGQVYEQYLGHVAQRVRQLAARPTLPGMPAPEIAVEAKRERRKQRGIYYTPKWVVDYIVRQTVGRFLEEHANDPEAIANLTILDPACGSGSFLIRAYETLLEHHARQMGGDVGHLDRKMREWVLRHNIFGVDLDPQAVEIARLNLLIRMVREEEELPPLADNICLGNSLISGGDDELRPYFGDAWKDKRPFDWQREFPDVMARGGFDIVIGNPPYLFGEQVDPSDNSYFRDHYGLARGQYDEYWLFYERSLTLLRSTGYHGFIVPDAVLVRDLGEPLRHMLLTGTAMLKIGHAVDAFSHGVSGAIVVFARAEGEQPLGNVDVERISEDGLQLVGQVPQRELEENEKAAFAIYAGPGWEKLRRKLLDSSVPLSTLASLSRGEEYGKSALSRTPSGPHVVPILVGEDISRYAIRQPRHYLESGAIAKDWDNYALDKIVVVKTGSRVVAALDLDGLCTLQSVYNVRLRLDTQIDIRYILGIMNSRLVSMYVLKEATAYKRIFPQLNQRHIAQMPIRQVPPNDNRAGSLHDRLVALVQRMLDLQQRLAAKGTVHDDERAQIEREIARTDREIDDLVYDLYGLTAAERDLVEREVAR
jgi:hypothetical protein